ncbi:MAG: hypothetical protein HDR26_07050 [Lachnospiraceae bacterium]|nr:hypothetical protein [Lachnospiraceae bacterium]
MKKWKLTLLAAAVMLMLAACGDEPAQTNGDNPSEGTQQQTPEGKVDGYVFVYNGVTISVDELMQTVLDQLGEPLTVYEAPSCAFDGVDKIYTYSSVEIQTYPAEDGDRISMIVLKDDMVSTPEQVSLFGYEGDITDAYGENYTEENGMRVYTKGGMKLRFILEGGEIVSIEYVSTVLD